MYFGTESLCVVGGGRHVLTDKQDCLGASAQGICRIGQAQGSLVGSSCAAVSLWVTLVPRWLEEFQFSTGGQRADCSE